MVKVCCSWIELIFLDSHVYELLDKTYDWLNTLGSRMIVLGMFFFHALILVDCGVGSAKT